MMVDIDNNQDILDSRDIITRIDELEAEGLGGPLGVEDQEELETLQGVAKDAEGSPDWVYGEALIRDSYFQEYAQELAEDCGMVDGTAKWPMSCLDWAAAAEELKADYSDIDYDGITYWIRA